MIIKGLSFKQIKEFLELTKKANKQQLLGMDEEIRHEYKQRLKFKGRPPKKANKRGRPKKNSGKK